MKRPSGEFMPRYPKAGIWWWPSLTDSWLMKGPPGLHISRSVPSMKAKILSPSSGGRPNAREMRSCQRGTLARMRVTSPGHSRCRHVLKMKTTVSSTMLCLFDGRGVKTKARTKED